MGVWDQLLARLSVWWTEWGGHDADAAAQCPTWLNEVWRSEQRLAAQLRDIAPALPYEQFRLSLEAMACDDEHHAMLLRGRLKGSNELLSMDEKPTRYSADSRAGRVWPRILSVLTEKRELFERYRQEAAFIDDTDLQPLLTRIRQDEARHQEQLVEILTHLDAHVHETIT